MRAPSALAATNRPWPELPWRWANRSSNSVREAGRPSWAHRSTSWGRSSARSGRTVEASMVGTLDAKVPDGEAGGLDNPCTKVLFSTRFEPYTSMEAPPRSAWPPWGAHRGRLAGLVPPGGGDGLRQAVGGQAPGLHNRPHPGSPLHGRQAPSACLHTSLRRTRRSRTSCRATLRKSTRGVLCFIRSFLAAASSPARLPVAQHDLHRTDTLWVNTPAPQPQGECLLLTPEYGARRSSGSLADTRQPRYARGTPRREPQQ